VVASSLMPPKEQGQAEDDGADGDGQPEEGVVAHPVMVPLVQGELSPILGDGLKDQAAAVWD